MRGNRLEGRKSKTDVYGSYSPLRDGFQFVYGLINTSLKFDDRIPAITIVSP
jgi:hypothetical protein